MTTTYKSSTPSRSSAPQAHVALLRGINVGGKNMLPMKALAEIFAAAGCGDVRTYIQSGNVVFTADATDGLATKISRGIADRFGLAIPVVLRSSAEMAGVLGRNPFVEAGVDESLLHVYFMAGEGTAAAVKGLDPDRSAGDTYVVSGREIYLHLPSGVARTKLTNVYFDRQLGTVCTLRSWKTARLLGSWMGVGE